MFNLSKRQSYFIAVSINFIAGVIVSYYQINIYYVLLLSALVTLAVSFLIMRTHAGYYMIDKLIYVGMFISFANLLLFNYPNINFGLKVLIVIVVSIFLYALFIAFNVYLVSEKLNEVIPLIQPARLVVIICTVVLAFISANVIYKLPFFINYPMLNLAFKVLLFAIYNYLIFYTIRWFFLESKIGDNRQKNIEKVDSVAGMAILFNTQLAFFLTLFPFEAFASAVILMSGSYISINLIQNIFNHKVEFKNILEYTLLFVFAVISAIFIS